MVAAAVHADLLILLSDVEGLYSDDPRVNKDASFIEYVPELSREYEAMGRETTGSGAGTGGMSTKLHAARIAVDSGCDMVIAGSRNGMHVIHNIMCGENIGTLFRADKKADFRLSDYTVGAD